MLLSPTWIHSGVPPGPSAGPPRPTQAATCPVSTCGWATAEAPAPMPAAPLTLAKPAYAYPDGPQPRAARAGGLRVTHETASAPASAEAHRARRKGFSRSVPAGGVLPGARVIGGPGEPLH